MVVMLEILLVGVAMSGVCKSECTEIWCWRVVRMRAIEPLVG